MTAFVAITCDHLQQMKVGTNRHGDGALAPSAAVVAEPAPGVNERGQLDE